MRQDARADKDDLVVDEFVKLGGRIERLVKGAPLYEIGRTVVVHPSRQIFEPLFFSRSCRAKCCGYPAERGKRRIAAGCVLAHDQVSISDNLIGANACGGVPNKVKGRLDLLVRSSPSVVGSQDYVPIALDGGGQEIVCCRLIRVGIGES